MISTQEIEHLADLARIKLNPDEIEKYQDQLGNILNYVEKLNQAKTESVPTADGGTRNLENVWREDKEQSMVNSQQLTEKENLIELAPETDKGQIKVKNILQSND